jgi:hypothetical protein
MERLYAEHDKIMLLKTGQVLTVHADLSNHLDPGIIVKEKVRRLIRRSEVRPAGHTRQRIDLERYITDPEPSPPPPKNCIKILPSEKSPEQIGNWTQSAPSGSRTQKLYEKVIKISLKRLVNF